MDEHGSPPSGAKSPAGGEEPRQHTTLEPAAGTTSQRTGKTASRTRREDGRARSAVVASTMSDAHSMLFRAPGLVRIEHVTTLIGMFPPQIMSARSGCGAPAIYARFELFDVGGGRGLAREVRRLPACEETAYLLSGALVRCISHFVY